MADMNRMIITDRGHNLIAKMLAGTTLLEFTKVKTSSHDYSSTILEELVTIENIEQESLINNIIRTDSATVEIEATFTNTNLTAGYYLKCIGLYAIDPDLGEILYAVTIADKPDYIPAFSGKGASGIFVKLITNVSNSSDVSLEIDPVVGASIKALNVVRDSINDHKNLSIQGDFGVHGLRYFNDAIQFYDENGTWTNINADLGSKTYISDVLPPTLKNGDTWICTAIDQPDPSVTVYADLTNVDETGTNDFTLMTGRLSDDLNDPNADIFMIDAKN